MSFTISQHHRNKWVQAQAKTDNCDRGNNIFKLPAHYHINNNSLYHRAYEHIRGTRGFTLLELIVVSALIGIMLTISVPSLRTAFFTNPLKSTARQVVGVINEVRQTAVRNQEPYNLHISQLENRIWYEKAEAEEDALENESDTLKTRDLQLPETVRLSRVWLQSSGVLSEDQTTFWISKKGYMEQAAIQLSDDFNNSLSVQLNPFTDPIAVTEDFPPSAP